MTPEDFAPLAISRYELSFRAHEACSLPAFLGSTLRGAFGHALRDTVRVIDRADCDGCSSAGPCAYHYLFETPVPPRVTQLRGQREAPVPFILSPPVVHNPVKRVWRMPAVRAASSAAGSVDPSSSLNGSAELGGFARNSSSAQFEITSVVLPDSPRRFRPGDTLSFDLVLIGRAVELINYVVKAIALMAQRGLGANRAKFELKEVLKAQASRLPGQAEGLDPRRVSRPLSELISERLVELTGEGSTEQSSKTALIESTIAEGLSESTAVARHSSLIPDPQPPIPAVRLRFQTPARIRVNGDLQTELSFELLVRNLLRRVSMLAAVHGAHALDLDYRSLIDRAKSVVTVKSSLHWWDLERYTNRQNGKLRVGGMIGELEYEGEAIKELLPLLVAGELLHVGTGTSFGLGKFVLPASGGS
jgi:hypothetical protein